MNGRLDAEQMAAKAEAAWNQMEAIRRQRWEQSVGQPGDLVQRLRDTAVPTVELCEEAAEEIERLRPAYATAVQRLAFEIARLRLTDAERGAVEWYAAYGAGDHAATLRGLLERTK